MHVGRTGDHYHPMAIGVHWMTLLLLVGVYSLIELRGIYPKGSEARDLLKWWHATLGLTALGLVSARLVLRLVFGVPPIRPQPPAWQQLLAGAMHWALYAFLFVMPLLGWLMLSAKGKPIPFFGLEFPALITPDKPLAVRIEGLHRFIGVLGYYLIGLHAIAALYHHYVMRDNALVRMLPGHRDGGRGTREVAQGSG